MLAVRGLTHRFGAFQLGPLELELEAGSYAVLLGPSGSGKTMLLQTLAGLFPDASGAITLDGRDVTRLPPERRGIGLVFQHAALFPHFSVRGNLEYGLRAQRLAPAERRERVESLIARLRLGPVLERPVKTLSGGEAQRVAIARTLATRPRLLLLDEPLSLLDLHARQELRAELAALHRELGLTTLHVTHDREEARALGQTLAVMLDGRVVQQGPLAEVLAAPCDPAAARFLDERPPDAAGEA